MSAPRPSSTRGVKLPKSKLIKFFVAFTFIVATAILTRVLILQPVSILKVLYDTNKTWNDVGRSFRFSTSFVIDGNTSHTDMQKNATFVLVSASTDASIALRNVSIASSNVSTVSQNFSTYVTNAPKTTSIASRGAFTSQADTTAASNTTVLPAAAGRRLICLTFAGRLGNELFEYASVLGLALTMNRTAVFKGSSCLEHALDKYTRPPKELEARCSKAKSAYESSCCKFSESLTHLDPNFDYKVGTFLQSYRYWKEHENEVKSKIVFREEIQQKAGTVMSDLRRQYNGSTLIGVHIRRGDFTSENSKKIGYRTATPEFLLRSATHFKEMFPNSVFVVSSDEIAWCRENFPKGFQVHFLDMHEAAVDLLILATTDHLVTSFGTYSWWAGYLNKGTRVYMKDFIVPGTFIGNQFNADGKDYVYPGWVPL